MLSLQSYSVIIVKEFNDSFFNEKISDANNCYIPVYTMIMIPVVPLVIDSV